jgi:transcription initiation factor TFIIA large subunit
MYNIPTGSSDYPTPGTENGVNIDVKARPSPYMPPPSPWTNPRLDVNVAYVDGRDEPERGNSNQQFTQDLFVPSSGKRKRDDSSAHYQNGGSIPQQDGASDAIPEANFECAALRITYVGDRKIPRDLIGSSSKIPQVDGPMPDPYDEMLSTPNVRMLQLFIE